MTIFICPNCEEHSEINDAGEEDAVSVKPFICPKCGQEFELDNDLNIITGNS